MFIGISWLLLIELYLVGGLPNHVILHLHLLLDLGDELLLQRQLRPHVRNLQIRINELLLELLDLPTKLLNLLVLHLGQLLLFELDLLVFVLKVV